MLDSSLRDKEEANAFYHERNQFSARKTMLASARKARWGRQRQGTSGDTQSSQHAETRERDTLANDRSSKQQQQRSPRPAHKTS